jgi:hypothetical protein
VKSLRRTNEGCFFADCYKISKVLELEHLHLGRACLSLS